MVVTSAPRFTDTLLCEPSPAGGAHVRVALFSMWGNTWPLCLSLSVPIWKMGKINPLPRLRCGLRERQGLRKVGGRSMVGAQEMESRK